MSNCIQLHPPVVYSGPKAKIDICGIEDQVSDWVELIYDLVHGAGYSYSRIAYRAKCSPSTIQKLATQFDRKPRFRVYDNLLKVYAKVFYGQYRSARARDYIENKHNNKYAWLETHLAQHREKYEIL